MRRCVVCLTGDNINGFGSLGLTGYRKGNPRRTAKGRTGVGSLALLTAFASFFGPASAGLVPLTLGGSVSPGTATESGTLLASTMAPFTFGSSSSPSRIVGDLYEGVYHESSGALDFAIQIGVTSTGQTGNVATFAIADFSTVTTAVGQAPDVFVTGNRSIGRATRSSDGSTLAFASVTPWLAGTVTYAAIIGTNATSFDQSGSVTLFNSGGGSFGLNNTFEPEPVSFAMPEPSTFVLWSSGFVCLACVRAFRRGRPSSV